MLQPLTISVHHNLSSCYETVTYAITQAKELTCYVTLKLKQLALTIFEAIKNLWNRVFHLSNQQSFDVLKKTSSVSTTKTSELVSTKFHLSHAAYLAVPQESIREFSALSIRKKDINPLSKDSRLNSSRGESKQVLSEIAQAFLKAFKSNPDIGAKLLHLAAEQARLSFTKTQSDSLTQKPSLASNQNCLNLLSQDPLVLSKICHYISSFPQREIENFIHSLEKQLKLNLGFSLFDLISFFKQERLSLSRNLRLLKSDINKPSLRIENGQAFLASKERVVKLNPLKGNAAFELSAFYIGCYSHFLGSKGALYFSPLFKNKVFTPSNSPSKKIDFQKSGVIAFPILSNSLVLLPQHSDLQLKAVKRSENNGFKSFHPSIRPIDNRLLRPYLFTVTPKHLDLKTSVIQAIANLMKMNKGNLVFHSLSPQTHSASF